MWKIRNNKERQQSRESSHEKVSKITLIMKKKEERGTEMRRGIKRSYHDTMAELFKTLRDRRVELCANKIRKQ